MHSIMKRHWIFGLAVMLLGAAGLASAHADPRGLWLAEDGAKVRVGTCGGGYICATIAEPKSRLDPQTGQPWTDKNNSDPALRNRPLIGVAVLRSLQPSGPGKWSGTLYNNENGNTYEGHLLELGPRTIRIEGCAIGICGGRNLSRIQ
jgi:uncharacterized protein (DUF2147 family)